MALYRAIQGLSFVEYYVLEIVAANDCNFEFYKNGAKYMYFLLDKKSKAKKCVDMVF